MISSFIRGDTGSLPTTIRKNAKTIHYYNEIIRFWNKLNFIIKKSFINTNLTNIEQTSKQLYAAYRILRENTSEKNIFKELKDIDRKFIKRIRTFSWEKALENKNEKEKLSILSAFPSFMMDHLLNVMDMQFLKSNIDFMNNLKNNMEITIRINLLNEKSNHLKPSLYVKNKLKKNKIDFHEDYDIPELLWVPLSKKNRIIRNILYQNNLLVFQDKASAAIIQVLSPKQEDRIYDMCAAPGMKTSLIAQYINNKGHILAGEFLTTRAQMMNNLLKKLNVLNVHILNIDSIMFPIRFQNYFDKILLDAPCTGSGTFLINPELKWRQNEKFLRQNTILQKKLLESALKLLKPNGILIYSTCSFYPEEGEYQILQFLDQLEPLDLPGWFSPSYKIKNKSIQGTGRLFPSIHHTQGFFIGKFKKKE